MLNRIFSTDSAKAAKAADYGFLNGIHYLAPFNLSGFNLYPHASAGCKALCLGWHSGQAGMVAQESDMNSVRLSRVTKARRFMADRANYMRDVVRSIELLQVKARKLNVKLCVRMNGASDIAWEGIACRRSTKPRDDYGTVYPNLFLAFPEIDFVDYTKNPRRFDRKLPANYHLTFSRAEDNESDCLALLARGVNVAIVFQTVPTRWNGFQVIDGDKHDLRQLDPRGAVGTVIGLTPKGRKAKKDRSGFVVRNEH